MFTHAWSFVLLIGILVFIHELGHFIVARLCGVGVNIFSLGFGPRLIGLKLGRTDYRISLIPLGGYVKMVGEDDKNFSEEDIPESFSHKHALKRIAIVAAGPLSNLVLAATIFTALFFFSGNVTIPVYVDRVLDNSPAAVSGLLAGDKIKAIDRKNIKDWSELVSVITNSKGKPLLFRVLRNGKIFTVKIIPKLMDRVNEFGETVEVYSIGISPSSEKIKKEEITSLEAIGKGFAATNEATKLTLKGFGKILDGSISPKKALGGPVKIVELSGKFAKKGFFEYMWLVAILSISLAILNALPIPPLDGGHVMFFTLELVLRRPVNVRIRNFCYRAGTCFLYLLIIFVFYNDITRMLFS